MGRVTENMKEKNCKKNIIIPDKQSEKLWTATTGHVLCRLCGPKCNQGMRLLTGIPDTGVPVLFLYGYLTYTKTDQEPTPGSYYPIIVHITVKNNVCYKSQNEIDHFYSVMTFFTPSVNTAKSILLKQWYCFMLLGGTVCLW